MSRDLELQKQRGIKAKQLIDDELVKSAFHDIKNNLIKKITSSSFKEQDEREDCYRMLRALESVEGQFFKHIQTGKVAENKLSLAQKVVKTLREA